MKKFLSLLLLVLIIVSALVFADRSNRPDNVTGDTYVALGDSVAAGVGLKTPSDATKCDRTDQAYSHVVAQQLNLTLTKFACSGATISGGLTGSQQIGRTAITPQLSALYERPKPNLITVTIGANDVDWTGYLKKCYIGRCGDADDSAEAKTRFSVLSNNLKALLENIDSHYENNPPRVIFTSYYQVFPSDNQRCLDLVGISDDEIAWARTQQAAIGKTVESVVKSSDFAQFATVSFAGHELCTQDPWVQGITDKNPYHPTEAGQAAIANAVIKTYRVAP